jgi:hypothetical protein
VFWLGIMLTLLFSSLGYTTIGGRYDVRQFEEVAAALSTKAYFFESLLRGDWGMTLSCARYLLVPGLALATIPMAVITRMTRSAVLEETSRDYVRTARAKGQVERVVIGRHVLRNALIPVVTITGLQFGALLSGAVLTETVFTWPGLGTYIVDADRKVVFWRPPYFEEIMTDEELANYVPALDALPDRLDRTRFVAEHIRTMYFRALERGVSAPSIEPFDDVFETLGEVAPDKPTRLSAKAAEAAAKSDEGDEAEPEAQPIVP